MPSPQRTQRTRYGLVTGTLSALPYRKLTLHALLESPAMGEDAQKSSPGVPGKNAWLIAGAGAATVKSTSDTSSRRVGRRQPDPLFVQYITAWGCVQVAAEKFVVAVPVPGHSAVVGLGLFSHVSPVTLSVTLPLPLSVYEAGFGSPAVAGLGIRPLSQRPPAAQSAALLQDVLHCAPPHVNGAQLCWAPATHAPLPLHVD
jgi:hypothetical protein